MSAINRGDRAAATALAGRVLAIDHRNTDAEELLSAAPADDGEIRRLTILFVDVVDSTVLSTRVEPETYRLVVRRYRDVVLRVVERYEGHIGSTKGDGLLAVFGHPTAHEKDVRRAVQAGLEITREIIHLSEQTQRGFGIEIAVRVGVHRGLGTSRARIRLASLSEERRFCVFLESPRRLPACLRDAVEQLGPSRWAVACRELTKMHEEVVRGSLEELAR